MVLYRIYKPKNILQDSFINDFIDMLINMRASF